MRPSGKELTRHNMPPFPFQVICVDNEDREHDIDLNKTYTATKLHGGAEISIQGLRGSYMLRRFILAPLDTAHWRTWLLHGLEPGHCVCRTPRELCFIHRDNDE